VPHHASLNVGSADFTLDLWVNFASLGGEQILVEKYVETMSARRTGWMISKLADHNLRIHPGDPKNNPSGAFIQTPAPLTSLPQNPLQAMEWHFFAIRRKGKAFAIFYDGVKLVEKSVGNATLDLNTSSTTTLKFGHRGNPQDTPGSSDNRGFYLKGLVDEVELFVGTALTDKTIQAIYRAGHWGKRKFLARR
jgi:hypothetical protein